MDYEGFLIGFIVALVNGLMKDIPNREYKWFGFRIVFVTIATGLIYHMLF